MKQYENTVLPSIQQRFGDANAGSSSALNQALSQSATDLQSALAGKRLDLQQNSSQNNLNVLAQLLGMAGTKQFDPIVQGPNSGLLPDLIKGGSSIAAASAFSSREVKENIRDYDKGLDVVREMKVKIYDYKEEVCDSKDCVGVIAEEIPEELTGLVEGIKGVDLYGLVSVLINSVKQLDQKVRELEAIKCQ
jgi:hypothetical protein